MIDLTSLQELKARALSAHPGPYHSVSPEYASRVYSDVWASEGWTVSPSANEHGWETDCGCHGYSISESQAKFFAMCTPELILSLIIVVEGIYER